MGRQFTITLPDDLADMVQAKVASGEFASVDEVIGAALAQSDDAPVHSGEDFEHWLRTEVVQTIEELERDPSRVLTSEQVAASIEEEYQRIMAGRRS